MNECFIFQKELLDIAEALDKCKPGLAGEFLYAAAQYGIKGEHVSSNPIVIAALAGAQEFFEKEPVKTAGGRPRSYNPQLLADMVAQGYSTKEVAAHFGCSIRTVQRALKNC